MLQHHRRIITTRFMSEFAMVATLVFACGPCLETGTLATEPNAGLGEGVPPQGVEPVAIDLVALSQRRTKMSSRRRVDRKRLNREG